MASPTAVVAVKEVEVGLGIAPLEPSDGRNEQGCFQAFAELPDQDEDDDYDEAVVFSNDFGGVGP